MAPIKFEESIREKMEQRKLPPSADAWSKLANRLEDEPTKTKKSYWWLGIAASFIGLVIVSVVMFNNVSNNNRTNPIIVDETIEEQKDGIVPSPQELHTNVPIESVNEQNDQIAEIGKVSEPTVNAPKKENLNNVIKEKSLQKSETRIAQDKVELFKDVPVTPEEIIKSQIVEDMVQESDAVATAEVENNTNEEVIDDEVTTLLNNARKQLETKQSLKTANTINADQLLLDIQDDLGQSFRNKIFEVIETSYKKVKTAVADRNN